MRWTAHISILLTIAAASASATVSSSAPKRHPAAVTDQAQPDRDEVAVRHVAAGKASTARSRTYADGYRKGFAAGRAQARKQAATRCPAPAAEPRSTADASAAEAPASETSSSPSTSRTTARMLAGPMPAPLRGSYTSLQRQNVRLEQEGLERIEDNQDLDGRIAHRLLVPLPASPALVVNSMLPQNRRYCRPWTARFLTDLAQAHDAVFHEPIQVNSAVRTVTYQKQLRQANGNAAPARGDVVSPHLTGAAVDIAKENLSRQELAWMRRQLLPLQQAGKIDVEEEFQQACFHITVYKNYPPAKPHGNPVIPVSHPVRRVAAHGARPASATVQPAAQSVPAKSKPARRSAPPAEPTEVIVSGQ